MGSNLSGYELTVWSLDNLLPLPAFYIKDTSCFINSASGYKITQMDALYQKLMCIPAVKKFTMRKKL